MLHDVHYITSLLHPSFKNFHINPHLKAKAIDLVKNEMLQRQLLSANNSIPTTATSLVSTSTSAQLTHSNSLLSKCFDPPATTQNSSSTLSNELDEYLNLNIQLNENDDVLVFWQQRQLKFPILTSIVRYYYAIPASNTIVERLFSCSKNTVTDKRTRLDTEKINKLLFLQKNLSMLKSFDKTSVIEVVDTQLKRKTAESSSSTATSIEDQEQMTTVIQKKIKLVEQDDIFY